MFRQIEIVQKFVQQVLKKYALYKHLNSLYSFAAGRKNSIDIYKTPCLFVKGYGLFKRISCLYLTLKMEAASFLKTNHQSRSRHFA
jgi:hypothetical protein